MLRGGSGAAAPSTTVRFSSGKPWAVTPGALGPACCCAVMAAAPAVDKLAYDGGGSSFIFIP